MTNSDWSVSETEVLESIGELLDTGRDGVLVTVTDVVGNAYRRPGAKMLVADESNVGSITAGCLENDVQQLADDVIRAGGLRVETYDLMEGDDVWGLGVGCNGVIDVLLEPVDESFRPAVEAAKSGEDIAVVTVLDPGVSDLTFGDRTYYRPDEGFDSMERFTATIRDKLEDTVTELIRRGKGATVEVARENGTVTLFVDGIAAPPELVVFGSGPDIDPVVDLAKRNGFRVSVVGFRGANDLERQFPRADSTSTISPANLRDIHEFDANTHAVVMTHNFVDDRIALDELLKTSVPYVGLLGPRERFEEMQEAFADEGRKLSADERERLYTPVGIDLGGGSPYQIATSIVAEVLAVRNDRTPDHLTSRKGPIHERIEKTVTSGEH